MFCDRGVSGKGVPASLLMATTLSLMRFHLFSNFEPQYVTNFINQGLLRSGQPDRFVTFFVGMLHLKSGKFKFCNAGHSLSRYDPTGPFGSDYGDGTESSFRHIEGVRV